MLCVFDRVAAQFKVQKITCECTGSDLFYVVEAVEIAGDFLPCKRVPAAAEFAQYFIGVEYQGAFSVHLVFSLCKKNSTPQSAL